MSFFFLLLEPHTNNDRCSKDSSENRTGVEVLSIVTVASNFELWRASERMYLMRLVTSIMLP